MKTSPVFFTPVIILLICTSMGTAGQDISRSNHGEFYYLKSGLIISQHVIEPAFNSTTGWHGMPDLRNRDSYQLTERQIRYLDIQLLDCNIDPFSPQPSINIARDQFKNCFRAHIWENEDIPHWAKIVGTTIALGLASEAGAFDSAISVNIDLRSVNRLLNPQNE